MMRAWRSCSSSMPDEIIYNNIKNYIHDQIMSYWLKINGTGDSPFDDGDWFKRKRRWVGDYGQVSMFPRVPSIEPGDRLIEYAAGSARFFGEGRLFAVSEAVSEPEPSPHVPRPAPGRTGDPGAGPRARHRAGPAE